MPFLHRVSGQFIQFGLVSAISGNAVIGASGAISGRRCGDAETTYTVLSGNIVEIEGGGYKANLYDFDVSGRDVSYYFTASGCVPVQYSCVLNIGISGAIYPTSGLTWIASGPNTVVPPSTLSGVNPQSGAFVTVLPANLSGVVANSGLTVTVIKDLLSGVVANSGLFVTAPIATLSGIWLASGSLSGQLVTLLSGISYLASGNTVLIASGQQVILRSGEVYLASGHFLFGSGQYYLASGSLSGQQVTLTSGISYTASGIFVTATAVVASGALYLASGSIFRETFASGVIGASGGFPTAWGDSGMTKPASGTTFIASGPFVNVPPSTLSGVIPQSGAFVTVLPANLSGVVANSGLFVTATATVASGALYLASGSLFRETFASGVIGASGGFPTAWGDSGMVKAASGAFVNAAATVASGEVYLASGHATFWSGQIFLASGSLSGQQVTLTSGVSYTASGIFGAGSIASGQVFLASGTPLFYSGYYYLASGQTTPVASGLFVTVPKETLSGIVANSGLTVTVIPATISGVVVNSGLFVNVPIATVSGINAVVPVANLSGIVLQSGAFVTVLPANLSGVVANSGLFVTATATVASGTVYLASGSVLFSSGLYYLASGQGVTPYSGQTFLASGSLSGQTLTVLSGTRVNIFSGQVFPEARDAVSGMISGIAATTLRLPWSGMGGNPEDRNLLQAGRFLRNKWATSGTTLAVFQEDSSTVAWSGTLTTNASGDPIIGEAPA